MIKRKSGARKLKITILENFQNKKFNNNDANLINYNLKSKKSYFQKKKTSTQQLSFSIYFEREKLGI